MRFMLALSASLILLLDGQVLAQFANVTLNIPPDPNIPGNASINEDALVRLFPGGEIGSLLDVNAGGRLEILGGTVGPFLGVGSGGEIRMEAGLIDEAGFNSGPWFRAGSRFEFAGGSIGDDVWASSGSQLLIEGNEFHLNGLPVVLSSVLAIDLGNRDVLSGLLSDGTPFAFSPRDQDRIEPGVLSLVSVGIDPVGDLLIEVDGASDQRGLRLGQTMRVLSGGNVGQHFNAGRGSSLEVRGGQVGRNLEAVDATIDLQGGTLATALDLFDGSQLFARSGTVGAGMGVYGNSSVEVFDGASVGDGANLFDSASMVVNGGSIGQQLDLFDGSTLTMFGGQQSAGLRAHDNAEIAILGPARVGTLLNSDVSLRDSSRLLNAGGDVNNLSIDAGSSARQMGGSIARLTVAGFMANCGGALENGATINSGGVISISGGDIGQDFDADAGSEVHVTGRRFVLNGVDITPTLELYTPIVITERSVGDSVATLSGNLTDRAEFSFDLNPTDNFSEDYFDPNALLTTPWCLPGDYNRDGTVNAADYTVWRDSEGQEGQGLEADGNFDGVVDEFDYEVWTRWYGEVAQGFAVTVPEPATGSLLTLVIAARHFRRRARIR